MSSRLGFHIVLVNIVLLGCPGIVTEDYGMITIADGSKAGSFLARMIGRHAFGLQTQRLRIERMDTVSLPRS